MKTPTRTVLLSLFLLAAFTSAHAQTNVTLDGTSGTNSITNNYSTDGGLNLSLGFFADYLVVGGGGGGGGSGTDTTAWGGGGGGAGGLLQGNTQLSASNYSVIVGAGGAGGPRSGSASAQQGTNGSNSVFGSLTAIGGGGGGAYKIQGNSGGSGGGGGGRGTGNDLRTPGGAGTTNGSIVQGFAGGASRDDDSTSRVAGGGGGGASVVGGTGGTNTSVAGDGGAGLTNSITGSAVVYAGGGGGGAFDTFVSDERAGTGGAGGGGAGSITGNASNGTNGLGGGGGGVGSQGVGGSGGSGVVIVRYQGASLGSIGGTVTSGTGTATGYTIHTFTNTGSTNLNMSGVDLNNRLGATLNGAITGNGNLSFAGPGTLTLGASNSYSGTTSLTNGALRLANAGTLGTGAVTNNSSLILDRSDALAVANDITGSGSLVQQGAGTSTLTGNNTYGGATTINAGTLQIGNGGTTGTLGAGAVTVASNNASLAINRSDNLDFDKAVAGNGSLVQAGSGTLTILGANVNSGGTVVSAGTMRVGNGGTTGSLGGGNIAISNAATLIYDRSDAVTLGSSLSGAGVLRQSGSGTLTITGNSTHSGGTVIDSGRTLQIGAGSTSGTVGSGAVTNNGTLIYNRSGFTTLANNISGAGSLDVTTTASFTTLSGSNTYSGATRIRGTEITIGQNALAGSTLTTFTNDRTTTLEVKATGGASAYNIGGLAGTRGVYLGSGLASVNVGGNNESTSLSGTLQAVGTGGLNKVGSGTLSLSGFGNSFTKGINIRSGAIEFAAGGDSTAFDILRVGQNNGDNGALLLSGGRLDAAILVGGGVGSTGTMTVTGGTNNFGFLGLHVGREGTGTLNLSGGTLTGNFASVAYTDGSTGTLNVTGGTLNASGNFQVGRGTGSTSTINLSGGQIIAGGDARFGIGVSNTTVFNISGGSFAHSGPVGLFINAYGGSNSQVTINLTDTGVLSTTRGIEYLTFSTNSSATINIGTGGAAGTLTAPTIGLAGPNSALNFNHTNSAYTLGAGILGSKLVLSHNGPGTTILTSSGFLDWKGGTVINNGTLQVGNGGSHSSLWAVHAITNNSVLVLNASNLTSMVGVMSGTGSLVKNGSGTLLLYADNTFSGGTTVNSGTLATATFSGTNVGRLLSGSALTVNTNGTFSLGVAQTLGSLSGAGAVLLGTNRLTVGADNSEFSGRMSGAGGLTKAGVGTFTLSGSNSFKGDTLVNDGRLILGSTTALGNASVVKVNSGGTLEATERVVVGYLDLNGGTIIGSNNLVSALTLINSGSVSGLANGTNYSAGILKRTVGVATVDGANSYTGTTRIEAGTVQLVEGGSFAAGSSVFLQSGGTMDLNGISQTFSALDGTGGTVSLGSGNLTVDGGVNSQFGGVIDGAGALVKSGTGTVTLLGANIYNGGTTVNAGRLIGNTTSLQGTITNFATVEFNQESNATLGASITGNGGVVKSGSGTMTVAGAQAYTGTTTVQAGDLKVNGSLAGGVDVQTSASLSGSGSVGAISGAGEINPGNSPGILTATSLNPSGGMTFNFEFTSINPTFSNSTASVNDLLRLTDATPFTASLTAANTVNIYFNVGAFGPEQTYTGAFFTDAQSDFLAQISNATFNYYVANTNGAIEYNGVNYTTLDESLDITLSTVNANGADFAGGTVNGQIAQFEVVPEPSTYALLALAAAGFAAHTLRRRRR